MDYVPDIDELIIASPYWLGTAGTDLRFQAHDFILDSDNQTLQGLVDKHLNKVFEGPGGLHRQARPRYDQQTVDLKYTVPKSARPTLSFLRYGHVDAEKFPNLGWLAYTEVLLWFPVKRSQDDTEGVCEALYFVALVYIDDSKFDDPVCDPFTIPIVCGRELFGMPKVPGQIRYAPAESDFMHPKLKIWDYGVTDPRLRLQDAIIVDPGIVQALYGFMRRALPGTLGRARRRVDKRDGLAFTAKTWGLRHGSSSFREPTKAERAAFLQWGRMNNDPNPNSDRVAAIPIVAADVDGCAVIFQIDLDLNSKLVGLKQFADPVVDPSDPLFPNAPVRACYQAVVETPIEKDSRAPWMEGFCANGASIQFPQRNRVKMIQDFGLIETAPGQIDVALSDVWYRSGSLTFANPLRTTVWDIA